MLAGRAWRRMAVATPSSHYIYSSAAAGLAARHCRPHSMSATSTAPPDQKGSWVASATPVDWDAYNSRWEGIWSSGLEPGTAFDIGAPSGTLVDIIRHEKVPVKGKRALVPGCGRGYDVVAFALGGASNAVGLEISETAINAANAYIKEQNLPADVSPRATVLRGDFFTHSATFDVGYDYTFFCALHPDMRKDWAAGWARIIVPGGYLITMVYPVDPDKDPNFGPPWPVTPQLYHSLLEPAGFECVQMAPIDPALSHPKRKGREQLGLWRRQK